MNVIRALLLPILYRKGGSRQLDYYRYMKKQQWASMEENIELQKKCLFDIVLYSIRNVPYYRDLGLNESDFRMDSIFEDIRKFPILTKKELRKDYDNLITKAPPKDKVKRVYPNSSSGSTGQPARFIQDNYYLDWVLGSKILFDDWAYRKLGETKVLLWGLEGEFQKRKFKISKQIADWIRNVKLLNSYFMGEEEMDSYVRQINQFKPSIILGFVQSIVEIAYFIQTHDLKIHFPRSIMTSAGTLFPKDREFIEKVFHCPVFDRYGSTEVGDMACECERHEGLHINIFNHYIEIVDDEGKPAAPGTIGHVLVTTLRNYSMPLIRYKIGDLAAMSDRICSCGRGIPIMDRVVGRSNSLIRTRKGVFDGLFITELMEYETGVPFRSFFQYQLIQKSITDILIKVQIIDSNYWPEEKEEIIHRFHKYLGEDIQLVFEEVESIEPLPSGKRIYIMSEVER